MTNIIFSFTLKNQIDSHDMNRAEFYGKDQSYINNYWTRLSKTAFFVGGEKINY